jgi:adenosine deaminase
MVAVRREASDDPSKDPHLSLEVGRGRAVHDARAIPRQQQEEDPRDLALREFLFRMPKIELHAHLNGCVRESTLLELACERGVALCPRLFPSPTKTSGESASTTPAALSSSLEEEQHPSFYHRRPRSLQDCFDVFAEIPKVVDDLKSLRRIALEALHDFRNEGTVYLELRTTPKVLFKVRPAGEGTQVDDERRRFASKREYLETVIDAIREFERTQRETSTPGRNNSSSFLRGRVIVAVDRARSLEDARENVELAMEMKKGGNPETCEYVVGIDVGGNPARGDLRTLFPLLHRAREEAGLFVTIHCAEIRCGGDDDSICKDSSYNPLTDSERVARAEAEAILLHEVFVPDRLGHALLLPPSLQTQLLLRKIPVETCPTSNVMTLELASSTSSAVSHRPDNDGATSVAHREGLEEGMRRHPQLSGWLRHDHPIAICTDDPGVFGTNLTREWELVVTNGLRQEASVDAGDQSSTSASRLARDAALFSRVSKMMVRSTTYAFCGASLKTELQQSIQEAMDRLIDEHLQSQ